MYVRRRFHGVSGWIRGWSSHEAQIASPVINADYFSSTIFPRCAVFRYYRLGGAHHRLVLRSLYTATMTG